VAFDTGPMLELGPLRRGVLLAVDLFLCQEAGNAYFEKLVEIAADDA